MISVVLLNRHLRPEFKMTLAIFDLLTEFYPRVDIYLVQTFGKMTTCMLTDLIIFATVPEIFLN